MNTGKKNNILIILLIIATIITVSVVTAIIISVSEKKKQQDPDYWLSKYEDQFKQYTYDCMDFDKNYINEMSDTFGQYSFVACSCEWLEWHKYYGEIAPPKKDVTVFENFSMKKVNVYDSIKVLSDSNLRDNILSCIESEIK